MNEVNEQNAVAVRSLALLGVDLCNRLSSLIVRGAEADFPSDWVANARRQFERLTHEALRHEPK